MRFLIDECLDVRLWKRITGHIFETVQYRKWKGRKNGDLLTLAEEHFDALITADQGIPSQQYISKYDIALIVLQTGSDNPLLIEELFDRIPEIVDQVAPGKVIVIKPE